MAQNFFRQSFEKQGFTDKSLTKWKPRSGKDKGKQRAILVKTGQLRAAVGRSLKSATFDNISFLVPQPYARIHNEGGDIHHKARVQRLSFGKKGFVKTKKAKYQQRASIGAHTTHMPQRRFIGNSQTLFKMIDEKIKTGLQKLHK